MWISPAFAQAAATPSAGAGDFFVQLVPLFLIIGIMYFLVLRPQQQRVKAHQALVAAVKRGDIVVTGGGIIGKVIKVLENEEVLVEIAEDVRIKIVKGTIADVRSKGEPTAVSDKSKNDDDDKK
jgi:preprotein translocase subunit YajC